MDVGISGLIEKINFFSFIGTLYIILVEARLYFKKLRL